LFFILQSAYQGDFVLTTILFMERQFFQETFIMDYIELKQMLDDIIAKLDELLELVSNSSGSRESFL